MFSLKLSESVSEESRLLLSSKLSDSEMTEVQVKKLLSLIAKEEPKRRKDVSKGSPEKEGLKGNLGSPVAGRPSKSKKLLEVSSVSDVFAQLLSMESNPVLESNSEPVLESNSLADSFADLGVGPSIPVALLEKGVKKSKKVCVVGAQDEAKLLAKEAKDAEKKAKEDAKEAVKKAKEDAKFADKKAKDEAKLMIKKAKEEAKLLAKEEPEVNEETKLLAKEAEKKAKEEAKLLAKEAEKKAKEDAKLAEKKAKEDAKEADKKAKEDAKEAEKKAKDEAKLAKEDAKKAKEEAKLVKEAKKAKKVCEGGVKGEPGFPLEEPSVEPSTIHVKKFVYEGVKYLKDASSGIVYNLMQDRVGMWDEENKKLLMDDKVEEEDECSEEEYE